MTPSYPSGAGSPSRSDPGGPAEVTDPADPRVADYVGLTDAVRRMRHDPAAGLFIAEGEKVALRAAAAGYPARSLLVSPQRRAQLDPRLLELGCPVHVASFEVLQATTGFHVHRGVLASFARLPLRPAADVLARSRRVVVMEEVTSHTNLGAVFRSAAGLGMDAVLLGPRSCDPLYRRSVRVSMGQVFAVPYAYLGRWPESLDDLRAAGFRVLALTPHPEATPLDAVRLTDDDRVALVLGAEGPGLTEEAMAASDERVRIPMAAGVDSLNVAAAAAVACWVLGRRPAS
jgi:tRNA G18 (ribose-2'-O)-methylase SpoU